MNEFFCVSFRLVKRFLVWHMKEELLLLVNPDILIDLQVQANILMLTNTNRCGGRVTWSSEGAYNWRGQLKVGLHKMKKKQKPILAYHQIWSDQP